MLWTYQKQKRWQENTEELCKNSLMTRVEKLGLLNDEGLWSDFGHLQESDHFYYMCTKFFSDGAVHKYFNPYDTPYEAFINYMNVLSDFILRVDDAISVSDVNFAAEKPVKAPAKKAAAKKPAAKKAPAKKAAPKKTTSTSWLSSLQQASLPSAPPS